MGQNLGCAAAASVSWALQLASSSRQQQGLWMRRDLSQEEQTGLCCSEPRAVVRLFPLELQERAYCKRTSLEIDLYMDKKFRNRRYMASSAVIENYA